MKRNDWGLEMTLETGDWRQHWRLNFWGLETKPWTKLRGIADETGYLAAWDLTGHIAVEDWRVHWRLRGQGFKMTLETNPNARNSAGRDRRPRWRLSTGY